MVFISRKTLILLLYSTQIAAAFKIIFLISLSISSFDKSFA